MKFFKLKDLDKGETIIFWGLIITFLLDLASTIFFVLKGNHNLEANILIWLGGWWMAPVVLFINLWVFYKIIESMQNNRKEVHKRFAHITAGYLFVMVRFLAVLNNFLFGGEAGNNVKPTTKQMAIFWITIMLSIIIIYYVFVVPFYIYSKDMRIEYNERT